MKFEIAPITVPGERLVALAEDHGHDLSACASEHDRSGDYPVHHIRALAESRFLYSPLPEEVGGLGVDSVHDVLLASTRLARGDAAVTIGVNMHLVMMVGLSRQLAFARANGNSEGEALTLAAMRNFVANRDVISAAISEPNNNFTYQNTVAKPDGESYVINGRKVFGTMSPAATLLNVSVRYTRPDRQEWHAFALIPPDSPGVVLNDDWDALGMRGSGSGSITLNNVRVPAGAMRDGYPAGHVSVGFLERYLTSPLFHASASVGIAEAAQALLDAEIAKRSAAGRRPAEHSGLRHLAAENLADLGAIRGIYSRAASAIDEHYARHTLTPPNMEDTAPVSAQANAAKLFVGHAAARVVDRAMTIFGGAAFMNGHAMARLYRDVRAAPFMHPMGDNLAPDFIGSIALGGEPLLAA